MIGQTVSHYRIVEKLGGGGMGVVYRAEDTRLGRQVALKFLPDHVSADPAALERFRREARAASAINHPHICTVYDIGEANGKPFLAMEFLQGVPLKDRIASGTIPVPQIIEWAAEIADALDAAHAAGIVHRDLKPANLFVTSRGQIKVLDFGLAKVRAMQAVGDATMTLAMSAGATIPGTTLGTIGYMSPEQARGDELDGRSDIFSFGAVLYEMATGRQAFEGRTPAMVFHAILSQQPPVPSSLNPSIPPELDRIITKCLEKDANDRYASAAHLAAELGQLRRDSTMAQVRAASGTHSSAAPRKFPVWAAVGVASVVLGAVVAFGVLGRDKSPRELKVRRLTASPPERAVASAAISRDGRYLAYSDPTGIRLLTIATNESRLLPETANMTIWGWTEAGDKLVAVRQQPGDYPKTWTIPVIGGGEFQQTPWSVASPDGKRAVVWRERGEMWLQGVSGGDRKLLDGAMPNLFDWSRDGTLLAFLARRPEGIRLMVQQVDTNTNHVVLDPQDRFIHSIEWTRDGRLLFSWAEPEPAGTDSNIWEIAVDRDTGEPAGEPKRLTNWEGFAVTQLSASDNGRLTAIRVAAQTDVYLAELRSDGALENEPRRFTLDERNDRPSGWTRDSKSILFFSDRNGTWDVMRQALDADSPQVIASGPDRQQWPKLAPDGETVVFASWKAGEPVHSPATLMRVPLSGGIPEPVGTIAGFEDLDCSPVSCVVDTTEGGTRSVWQFDAQKGKGRLLFKRDRGGNTALSPDGTMAAYSPGQMSTSSSVIRLMRLSDGALEREISVPEMRFITSLEWDAAGKGFYAGAMVVSTGAILLHVDLNGRTRELWRQTATRVVSGVPSPDAKHLAIYGATRDSNVWLLEDY